MSPTQVKEETFELNTSVSGISSNDLAAATADNSLQILWEYPIPTGYSLVFSREDIFSAYLEDSETTPAESVASTKVDVVIMDSAKQNARSLLNELRYGNIKEFEDVDKLVHLDIPAGEQVIAREGERVCIRANNTGGAVTTLDVDDSYFRLTCRLIRHTLFA